MNRSSKYIPEYRLSLVKEKEVEFDSRIYLRTPKALFEFSKPYFEGAYREIFMVVLVNTAHAVIGTMIVFEGGLATSVVEARYVFAAAVLKNAAAIMCVHNHPSGNAEPSKEDILVTRQLARAGEVLGIPLRDHLIVTDDSFVSLAEKGLMSSIRRLTSVTT